MNYTNTQIHQILTISNGCDLMSSALSSDELRKKILSIISQMESRRLFLHHEKLIIKKNRSKKVIFPRILTLAILNALVPKGTMLLYGGHGGGKTTLIKLLGRMMAGLRLNEIEDTILRGHPNLTEEKVIARFNYGKLMTSGKEEIEWRPFTLTPWKIIDEVNRIPPPVQNILFSLLAEGIAKYGNQSKTVRNYVLFATLNPKSVGTYDMSAPFMDRFSIAVPITMPRTSELMDITNRKDEKLYGFDEDSDVPAILTMEDLENIWFMIDDEIEIPEETQFFINYIIPSLRACDRQKENNELIDIENGLCEGCRYNLKNSICNKIKTPPSVRAAIAVKQYSKALAWIMDMKEVTRDIVAAVLPFVLWHRIQFSEFELRDKPYFGDKMAYTEKIIKMLLKDYSSRGNRIQDLINDAYNNKIKDENLENIKLEAESSVYIKTDILPVINELNSKTFQSYRDKVNKISKQVKQITNNTSIKNKKLILKDAYDLLLEIQSNKQYIPQKHKLDRVLWGYIFTISKYRIETTFDKWINNLSGIIKEISTSFYINRQVLSFFSNINKGPLYRVHYGLPDIEIKVRISDKKPDSKVVIEIAGGPTALDIAKFLDDVV